MSNPKPEVLEVVAVSWNDATYEHYVQSDTEPLPMLTFGYVLEENERYIKLAGEVWGNSGVRHIFCIPKGGMDGRIVKVGTVKLPQSMHQYRVKHEYYDTAFGV